MLNYTHNIVKAAEKHQVSGTYLYSKVKQKQKNTFKEVNKKTMISRFCKRKVESSLKSTFAVKWTMF